MRHAAGVVALAWAAALGVAACAERPAGGDLEIFALRYGHSRFPERLIFADETGRGTRDFAWLFYLVRTENDCPGDGTLGVDSAGTPRTGRQCPEPATGH